ncbi:MAG TPA: 3-dehydroquinate synthase [Allosphingosinicella sp.]|jgi:3-dehydroquinate synthase
MIRIDVALGERSYCVTIGERLLDRAGEWLAPHARGGRIVAVSDANVWPAQGARLAASGLDVEPVLVPAGEGSKSWARLEALTDRLLELGVGRGDALLAFGGGMVGDLAGFAASVLKRGCAWVQVPTTLLAQVDSSVGGKTAINAAAGKNLIGAFHQPAAVLIDPTTLDTLPARELRAGYAEVVKYGLIADPAFFDWCESNAAALLAGEAEARLHAIATCVRAKAAIVAQDELETTGRRALLNFGHTLGHAIEAETEMLHGEAVAIGMAAAFRRSVELGLCPPADSERVIAHLESVGLPTTTDVPAERLAERMRHDKKGGARVLTRGIGKAFLGRAEP